jgi:hypothetical protein
MTCARFWLPVQSIGEMRRVLAALAILIPSLAFSGGCRSQQLGYDQNQFRQVLLQMYEDQLMDNLIRARNRMPLLQLDYTNITGTVTHAGTASVGGGPTGTRTTTFVKPTAATAGGSLVRLASQAFNYNVNASQINQLTVTANPIVDNSALYMAYLNFVERPGRLVQSCDPPPPGAAHVVREVGKEFYWVPAEYRNEYLELALRTNGVRTDPSDAAAYYEVTVTGATAVLPASGSPAKDATVTITLGITGVLPKDDGVPNDRGWMTAVLKGREWRFKLVETRMIDLPADVQRQHKDKKDEYTNGTPTRTLKLRYIFDPTDDSNKERPDKDDLRSAPFLPGEIAEALASRVVRVELDHYKPTAPALEDTLGSIRTQAELLRLNQLQLLNK